MEDLFSTDGLRYDRLNEFRTSNVTEDILLVDYEDGHWSKPYYDCGGGNIWMMTYTVPFFGYNHTTHQYHFMGTSGIDIDLRRVDIDQCPLKPGSTDKNVFAGSAKCKPTTQCEPISGLGFSRGSYVCRCQHGYYFPDKAAYENGHDHFNGTIIEQEFEKRSQGLNNTYETGFICLPCAEGCTEGCKDASPCIAALNWSLRTAILVAAIIVMACLPVLFYFTFQYAEVKVIKAASPVLLRMVLVGAFLLYGPIIVLYPVPSVVSCTARVWLRGVGFAVSYGAILLKTWRISVVFRVRSAQRVKITDNNLVKRLCLIVGFFAFYLTVRTVVAPPEVKVGVTDDNLKAFLCQMDYWDYAQAGGELLLLLWGIKLCFVVRKAPSEFNESKFISWAIYNEFLLSLFLNISMLFLQRYANPDVLYIILFAHSQLTTTVVLVLLFGSKAYMVYKGMGKGSSDHAATTNAEPTRSSAKFITKKKDRAGVPLTSSSTSAATLNCNHDSYKGQLPGNLTPKEVQDEFKRLYLQLELLKTQNMRLGNPHLTMKLHAMTEAAGIMPDDVVRPHNLATCTNSVTSCLPYPSYPPPGLHTPSSPSDETAELMEPTQPVPPEGNRPKPHHSLVPNNVLIATPTLIPMDPEVTPVTSPVDDVTSVFSSVSLPKYANNVAQPGGIVIPTSNSLDEMKHRAVQSNHVNQTPQPPFEFKKSRKAFEITI
ncbi:hypothetical protein RvY_07035-2 [Ramazzottius varieornatus]|uniref:G-protein coupled receptors family 3 profile domain-containing protein n=1 Tax=Ramazzottius varieornatus TaxID=947166 RepID=A0A1D1V9A3_RAMVA|nr:hypothetical protein RvY_07035-2 [Ramazzottius varieornatus]